MTIEVDNSDYCIRLYKDVAYIKVFGLQDEKGAMFFKQTLDNLITGYRHAQLASLCDLRDLILSDPKTALIINEAIKKVDAKINYKCNAIIIRPKFMDVIKAFIFSYYLKNTHMKSKIFFNTDSAIKWLRENGFVMGDIKTFLGKTMG